MRASEQIIMIGGSAALGGGGRPSALMIAKAQAIIASQAAYTPRTIMSSPPTMTVLAAFASSTRAFNEPGSPNVHILDPLLAKSGPYRIFDGVNEYSGLVGSWMSQDIRIDGGDGSRFAFKTNSRYVEFSDIFGQTNDSNKRIGLRINGQWATAADYVLYTTPDYNPHWASWDAGSTATRTWEFFPGQNSGQIGFNIVSGATLAAPDSYGSTVKSIVYGDSFTGGAGTTNRGGIMQVFTDQMGQVDGTMSGRPGQGYTRLTDSRTINQRMVVDTGILPAPDYVVFYGSVNDGAGATATITANFAAAIAQAKAEFPNAWIFVISSFSGIGGSAIDSTRNAAFIAGAQSVADARTIILDRNVIGIPVFTTTGNLPNSQPNDSLDGTHPGPNQIAYTVPIIITALIAALKARCGL